MTVSTAFFRQQLHRKRSVVTTRSISHYFREKSLVFGDVLHDSSNSQIQYIFCFTLLFLLKSRDLPEFFFVKNTTFEGDLSI